MAWQIAVGEGLVNVRPDLELSHQSKLQAVARSDDI